MSISFIRESNGTIFETSIIPFSKSVGRYAILDQPIDNPMGMTAQKIAETQGLVYAPENAIVIGPFPLNGQYSILTYNLATHEVDLPESPLFLTESLAFNEILVRSNNKRNNS